MEAVIELRARGGPVLGICNGFQVLCEARAAAGRAARERVAQVRLPPGAVAVESTGTPFTSAADGRGAVDAGQAHDGPLVRPLDVLEQVEANRQVVLRYAGGTNPNGSLRERRGVCSERATCSGLMPHAEHAVRRAHRLHRRPAAVRLARSTSPPSRVDGARRDVQSPTAPRGPRHSGCTSSRAASRAARR
jgi:phosphoribosylformylglycinamidine synthase